MEKLCKYCEIILNEANKCGRRLCCKPCRSKKVIADEKKNPEKRRARINSWARKIGKVKEYPCEICLKPCIKKYSKAFCSDKCRFFSHVEVTAQCWFWTSAKNIRGYGQTNYKEYKKIGAHRLSYILFIGPIEDDKFVCHSCDNPSCVRPSHLWLGTTQDNKEDQIKKGRSGIKLTKADVIQIRKLYDQGVGSQKIAYMFSVTCGTISNIAKRRIWKHI